VLAFTIGSDVPTIVNTPESFLTVACTEPPVTSEKSALAPVIYALMLTALSLAIAIVEIVVGVASVV